MQHSHQEFVISYKRRNQSKQTPRTADTEANVDRLSNAEITWGKSSSLLLDFSLTTFTSHHYTSLYSNPAECEVITLYIRSGENYYNFLGKPKP
jgi:hypothetical protein